MATVHVCDGPKCQHVGPVNPDGWLRVTIGCTGNGTSPLQGDYEFAAAQCFHDWVAVQIPDGITAVDVAAASWTLTRAKT